MDLTVRGKACIKEVLDTVTELLDGMSHTNSAEDTTKVGDDEIRDIADKLKSRFQELKDICKTFAASDKLRRDQPTVALDRTLVARRDELRRELQSQNAQLKKLIDSSRNLLVQINVTTPLESA
ncbi:uncharacterized protein LOC134195855 [Corticium candelabrum]|uniref:uncharacterized protein LOC134195855 n=1 Tax=Corticium candelabrum TaxID=121492 RepID=UPI002E26FBFB|nr:uncharacterized protein LOC134195855 [Corticium candelabrum]